MQVGDLVKCLPADGEPGVIIKVRPNGPKRSPSCHGSFVYDILIRGGVHPFLPSQLEVISESR
jgi:hypothetical protein